MARATEAKGAAEGTPEGPRRAGLLQERSRRTRHELVRAALTLWTERGFERGIDETTVEEIAQAAGVSKTTFYFHFASKEDILLEMGIETAEAMMKEAQLGMRRGRPATEILQALMSTLARRVERAPKPAVFRSVAGLSFRAHDMPVHPIGAVAFSTAFTAVAAYGAERGEFPPAIDADNFGALLQAVTMDTLMRWAKQTGGSLRSMLVLHTDLVVAGATAVYEARPSRRAAGGRASR